MPFFLNTLLISPTYSAFASEALYLPPEPVYLFKLTPNPKNPALFVSETEIYNGSTPASTSADNIFELQNTLSSKFGLLILVLLSNSDINVSNTCDSIPVFPMLPISSLSENKHTAVFLGFSIFSIALKDVYTHTLSSCPYALIKLSSSPSVLALNAGTTSSSLLTKSSSVIPYFLFNNLKILSLTLSFESLSSLLGILPINKDKFSALIASDTFFCCCSLAK